MPEEFSNLSLDLFALFKERRGITDKQIEAINTIPSQKLLDLDKAVYNLQGIFSAGAHITIVPDFDVDGITSAIIGYVGLKEMGFNAHLHIPNYKRGHGVKAVDIDEVMQQFPQTQAIMTCDVGITAFEGIKRAKEYGLFVIVTDHHKETEGRTDADIIVDPSRYDDDYPNKGICGAHVIHRVLEEYAKAFQPWKVHSMNMLRLFAGIGTVADVMPILYENRKMLNNSLGGARLFFTEKPEKTAYNPEGLINISNTLGMQLIEADNLSEDATQHHCPEFTSAFAGIATIIAMYTEAGKLRDQDSIDEGFYGFYLAPAFNAIRRTGMDIAPAFEVFLGENKREAFGAILANNEYRKELVEQYVAKIEEDEQPYAPYIYFTDAPAGVLGLLANNVMAKSGQPSIVMNAKAHADGSMGGSARSPLWFPLNTIVNDAGFTAVGHEHACGVSVKNSDSLRALVLVLKTQIAHYWDKLQQAGGLSSLSNADITIGIGDEADVPLSETEVIQDFAVTVDSLKPFGHQFEEPVIDAIIDLSSCNFRLLSRVEPEDGSEPYFKHFSMTTSSGMKFLWWNKAEVLDVFKERIDEFSDDYAPIVRLRGKLRINEFMGATNVDFQISEIIE